MEKTIKEYQKFIKLETSRNLSKDDLARLERYHQGMMANFQQERACHLRVMFFFITITLITLFGSAVYFYCACDACLPLYLIVCIIALNVILVLMSFSYVKHYYFLENNIQELYKYNKKIYNRK